MAEKPRQIEGSGDLPPIPTTIIPQQDIDLAVESALRQRKVERDPEGRLILYHATTARGYAMIEKDSSLKPASKTGSRAWRLEHETENEKTGNIYLAAKKSSDNVADTMQRGLGGTIYVLEVHVDQNGLVPDQDSHAKTWYESLEWLGTCAYKGDIDNFKLIDKLDFKLSEQDGLRYRFELSSTEEGSAEEKKVIDKWEEIKKRKELEEQEEVKRILNQESK